MSKGARALLVVGLLLQAYMVYLAACAGVMGSGLLVYVLPFFGRLNANGLGSLINWTAGLMLGVWIAWAVKFLKEVPEE